jgi:hypothetical protein
MVVALLTLTACSSSDDNPVTPTPGVDSRIVGNWYADVSGKTYAKWNYGETWQNTVKSGTVLLIHFSRCT